MPVIGLNLNNCGLQEIGDLYITLKALLSDLEKEYPLACLNAILTKKDVDTIYKSDNDSTEGGKN